MLAFTETLQQQQLNTDVVQAACSKDYHMRVESEERSGTCKQLLVVCVLIRSKWENLFILNFLNCVPQFCNKLHVCEGVCEGVCECLEAVSWHFSWQSLASKANNNKKFTFEHFPTTTSEVMYIHAHVYFLTYTRAYTNACGKRMQSSTSRVTFLPVSRVDSFAASAGLFAYVTNFYLNFFFFLVLLRFLPLLLNFYLVQTFTPLCCLLGHSRLWWYVCVYDC